MKSYDTLSQAITGLQKEGYTEDLNLQKNHIECKSLEYQILPNEFEVDLIYRFEGDSNPDDSSILFAISSKKYKIKGILIDAYGLYSDPLNAEMINKLKYKP
ncbi:hypothetical protein GCM10022393_23070 [Aquimarina addita]|uniref:Phosphoribosylpyrophosphate synthetase n=1 Tax=Aquimarina addita TaxID=870485 RepID=A0ABP6UJH5_9FLAO